MTKVGGTALSARPLKFSSVGVEGARAGRVIAAHEGLGAGAVSRLPRSRKRTPWLPVALATRTQVAGLGAVHGHQKPQKPTTTKAHAAESNAVPPTVARADAAPAGVGRVRPGGGGGGGPATSWAADAEDCRHRPQEMLCTPLQRGLRTGNASARPATSAGRHPVAGSRRGAGLRARPRRRCARRSGRVPTAVRRRGWPWGVEPSRRFLPGSIARVFMGCLWSGYGSVAEQMLLPEPPVVVSAANLAGEVFQARTRQLLEPTPWYRSRWPIAPRSSSRA